MKCWLIVDDSFLAKIRLLLHKNQHSRHDLIRPLLLSLSLSAEIWNRNFPRVGGSPPSDHVLTIEIFSPFYSICVEISYPPSPISNAFEVFVHEKDSDGGRKELGCPILKWP